MVSDSQERAAGRDAGEGAARRGDVRRAAIHRAAIQQFSERGLARTSMADIAAAAGVSRPALYQYFDNKDDIFASAFISLFDDHVRQALDVVASPGTLAERLDGFLQRYEGDLWERMAASPHTDEIVSAKNVQVATAVAGVVARLWEGLAAHLADVAPGRSAAAVARREGWVDMLRLAPKGFRFDQPPVDTYRRRLSALARSVAADIERS